MEQIRIIKEMRKAEQERGRTDEFVRPRYMVWENVPGALSSNKGEDFRCVLEETARVIQEDVCIPMFEGGWPHSGSIILEHGSIAWRVHDAQYWGVPQRRKRICVLADFNGFTAERILLDPQFERTAENGEPYSFVRNISRGCEPEVQPLAEGMSGDSEPSEQAGQEAARSVRASLENADWRYEDGTFKFNCPEGI